jgi:hypothetical protein
MRTGNDPLHDPVRAARGVADALRGALGGNLAAVYLHGSAVLGGFRWDRSDLDVLGLSRLPVSDEQVQHVVDALDQLAYPANGLEFSLMTGAEAAAPVMPAPRFQLHVATRGRAGAGRVVDGRGRAGDSDLVLHLVVCRARGLAVVGPPPRSSLAAVPDAAILTAMLREVDWARENAEPEYLVLTCARAWLFSETRRIASKLEAGRWARRRYGEPAVIEAALARQSGAGAAIDAAQAERLAAHVVDLARSAGSA